MQDVSIEQRWEAASRLWQAQLGADRVLAGAAAQRLYGADCSGLSRRLLGALRPHDAGQVPAIVQVAAAQRLAVHPISTGRNWGYGTALPPDHDTVLLDLSGLDRILHFDEELGVVTLEPGVTQGRLDRFLRGLDDGRVRPFMVPTTGAGPDCSLVGNALERGYGITPHADHFGAVTDVEAVLPDGRLYRTALREAAGDDLARLHKWGLGAYTAGLFSQSGLGVVTQMSIVLARRPEAARVMLFSLREDRLLEQAVAAVHDILAELPGIAGGINLMNRHRVMAMTAPYPFGAVPPGGVMPEELVESIGREFQVFPWTGFGTLYGTGDTVRAAQRHVRRRLRGIASRLLFVSDTLAGRLVALAGWLPGGLKQRALRMAETLQQGVAIAQGTPGRAALPLAYWRLPGGGPPPGHDPHPARDGSGLYWYAPLVPMRPAQVRQAVEMVRRTTRPHGIEPLLTLTSLNDRLFDCTVPVLFDPAEPGAAERARQCLEALQRAGRDVGAFPYRVDIDSMQRLRDLAPDSTRLLQALGDGMGGSAVVSPGRYFQPDRPSH